MEGRCTQAATKKSKTDKKSRPRPRPVSSKNWWNSAVIGVFLALCVIVHVGEPGQGRGVDGVRGRGGTLRNAQHPLGHRAVFLQRSEVPRLPRKLSFLPAAQPTGLVESSYVPLTFNSSKNIPSISLNVSQPQL